MDAAVEIEDHTLGSEVDLEEKPQNMVELEIGGDGSPFLLRLIHFQQNSMQANIQVQLYNTIRTSNQFSTGWI